MLHKLFFIGFGSKLLIMAWVEAKYVGQYPAIYHILEMFSHLTEINFHKVFYIKRSNVPSDQIKTYLNNIPPTSLVFYVHCLHQFIHRTLHPLRFALQLK